MNGIAFAFLYVESDFKCDIRCVYENVMDIMHVSKISKCVNHLKLNSIFHSVKTWAVNPSRGREFEHQINQYYVQRLTKVNVTRVIRIPPMG